jgi:uncharacterized protein YjiS (DUF1127 family)
MNHTIDRVASPTPLGRFAARFGSALRRSVAARAARRELENLPDEILREMGLTRGDIPFIARR